MKTRNGFVSNSSSSSFIVAFPKKPTSWQELQRMVFQGDLTHTLWTDDVVNTEDLAQVIWWDIQLGSEMDGDWVLQDLSERADEIEHKNKEMSDLWNKCWDKDLSEEKHQEIDDLMYELKQKIGKKIYKKIFAKAMDAGAVAYQFKYEDHSSLGGHLDHGDVFKNLPHIRICEH